MVSEPVVAVTITEGVAEIVLNRPDKLNALNEIMHRELAAALERAARDEAVRAVLLTGAGRGFCAGQDLSERAFAEGEEPDLGATLERWYNPLIRRLRALEKPVVCAVNGVAAGAGANIALACDIVLAARSARFIQAFVHIGLIADSGGSWFLPRLVGEGRARALLMLGEPLEAERAQAWGLIWKVVEDARLLEEARELARRLARGPTRAYALLKRALDASPLNTLEAQLSLERDLQRQAGRSRDYREGVRAFLEKRAPRFEGR